MAEKVSKICVFNLFIFQINFIYIALKKKQLYKRIIR